MSHTLDDVRTIRNRAREELGKDFLTKQSKRVFWFVPLVATVIGLWLLMSLSSLPWWGMVLGALVIGHCYAAMGFLAHEVSHGAMGLKRSTRDLISGIGFAPYLVTPDFWYRWHNIAHHGNTNDGNSDPDSFGTISRYEKSPQQKWLLKIAPGSGTWYSYLFLFYSFALHSQAVLWLQTKHRKEFEGFKRKKAILGMFALLAAWISLGFLMGAYVALFALVIPFLLGNFFIQSYILTNHFMRPQDESANPLKNSMSVRVPKWVDRVHFHFSHHVEHHLFPVMPSSRAPELRAWLEQNYPDLYVAPTHVQAVKSLYRTPRVYLNAKTLVDINDALREKVDIELLNENWLASA